MTEYSSYSSDPTARFNEAVNRELASGSKIESQHDWTVVFTHGKPVKHVMHAIITLVTCGIWAWGWAIVSLNGGVRRVRVYVDKQGQVRREEEPLPPWYKRGGGIALICLIVLAIIAGIAGALDDNQDPAPVTFASTPDETATTGGTVAPPATKGTPAKPVKVAPPKLSQEEKFVALISTGRDSADAADNQFRRRLALTKRNDSICKLLKPKSVKNWTGQIKDLDTNGDGLGVLSIQIGDNVKVGTWNNALSDFEDNTLIKKSSSVFDAMADVNEGDTVTFSGTFISDSSDCVGVQNLTDDGATQNPTFTFRFSKLAKK